MGTLIELMCLGVPYFSLLVSQNLSRWSTMFSQYWEGRLESLLRSRLFSSPPIRASDIRLSFLSWSPGLCSRPVIWFCKWSILQLPFTSYNLTKMHPKHYSLYAGQEIESPTKPPTHSLCLFQACLIYARFVLCVPHSFIKSWPFLTMDVRVALTTLTLTFTVSRPAFRL